LVAYVSEMYVAQEAIVMTLLATSNWGKSVG
jgi:hypothetical protein